MTERFTYSLKVERVALLLLPNFHSHTLTAITSVLRLTNREFGRTIFEWTLVSQTGGGIKASDKLTIETLSLEQLDGSPTVVFVLAAYQPLATLSAKLRLWLIQRHHQNSYLVGVESGTLVLAEAGLLSHHAAALHFEDEGAFREQWAELPMVNGLYNFEERVATAAGAAATLDFALAFVEKRCGRLVADQVARVLLYNRRDALGRPLDVAPHQPFPAHILQRCRAIMLQNLERPISIPTLCQAVGINERRLRRLFNKALGVSPARYYLALRLTEARFMLIGTELSVTKVGLACGFDNASGFARAFKAHFGFPPSQHRTPYMGLLPSPFWSSLNRPFLLERGGLSGR